MDVVWEAIRYGWETSVWLYRHRERARGWRQAALASPDDGRLSLAEDARGGVALEGAGEPRRP